MKHLLYFYGEEALGKKAVQQVNIEVHVHVTKSEYHQWYMHPWIENFSSLS